MEKIHWLYIILGGAFCYLGFPLFQASVLTFGFLAGGGLGYSLGEHLYDTQVWSLGLGLAGGLAGILVLKFFVRGGLFLAGCLLGSLAGGAFLEGLVPLGLCGLAGGVLFLFASRPVLILATSLLGASLLSQGVLTIPVLKDLDLDLLLEGVFILCLISGIIIQRLVTSKD